MVLAVQGSCDSKPPTLNTHTHARTHTHSTHHQQIEGQVQAILEDMVGPPLPGATNNKGAGQGKGKAGAKKGEQTPLPHVKVMILNSGNLPMFLNMMCSGREGVRGVVGCVVGGW